MFHYRFCKGEAVLMYGYIKQRFCVMFCQKLIAVFVSEIQRSRFKIDSFAVA